MNKTMTAVAALMMAIGTTPAAAQVSADTDANISIGGATLGAGVDANLGGDNGVSADADVDAGVGGGNGIDAGADANVSVGGSDDDDDGDVSADAAVDATIGGGEGVDADADVKADVGDSADANVMADIQILRGSSLLGNDGLLADTDVTADLLGDDGTMADVQILVGSADDDAGSGSDDGSSDSSGDGSDDGNSNGGSDDGSGGSGDGSDDGTDGAGSDGDGSGDGSGTDGGVVVGEIDTITTASLTPTAEVCANIDWFTDETASIACLGDVRLILYTDVAQSDSVYVDVFDLSGFESHPAVEATVESNDQFMAALDAKDFGSDDVVAIRASEDGEALLFVDDRV